MVGERRCTRGRGRAPCAAITSIGAPPSDQSRVGVAVALQRGAELGALALVDGGLVVELLEVLVDASPSSASAMTLPVDGADARAGPAACPSAWRCASSSSPSSRTRSRALREGLHPSALGASARSSRYTTRSRQSAGDMVAAIAANLPARVPRRGPRHPYPGEPYGTVRVRRAPQRRQVVAVQRAGRRRRARGAVRVRHHRPERRRGPGARTPASTRSPR